MEGTMSIPHTLRRAFHPAGLSLLLLAAIPGSPAADVTRSQALAIVETAYVTGHPEELFLEIYSPLSPLPAGTDVRELFADEPILAVPSTDTWFFWINYLPRARFGHDTRFVGVRKDTGSIEFDIESDWWPVLGGIERYRTFEDRDLSGELAYPVGPKPKGREALRREDEARRDVATPRPGRPASEGARPLAPPAPGKVCAVVISAEDTTGACNSFRIDFLRTVASHDTTNPHGPRVRPDSIRTAVHPDSMAVCQLIESIPKGYDKLYVYWIGHGAPNTGQLILRNKKMRPIDLMCKIKERMAKNVCLVIDACFSGNHVEAMCQKGLCGPIFTSTNSTEAGWEFLKASDGRAGSVFNEAWNHCVRQPHASAAEVYACARDSVKRFCQTLPANDPKTRAGGQHPQLAYMYEYTRSGQSLEFADVPGCSTMCFKFYNVAGAHPATCANATLYCEQYDFNWGFTTSWQCVRGWNWNAGKTRYFNPNRTISTGKYQLAVHSNYYPVRVGVTWPANAVPDTPSNAGIFPAHSVGWNDRTCMEFNPVLGTGSGGTQQAVYIDPAGWPLCAVPKWISRFDTNPLRLCFPVDPDPLRPFLYVNGDPLQGLNGDLVVTLGASELLSGPTDVSLRLDQPGGNSYLTSGTLFPGTGSATETQFVIPYGNARVEDMWLTLEVLPGQGPGFALDFLTVDFLLNEATDIEDPDETSPPRLVLLGSYPNPFLDRARIAFELPRRQEVTLRIYDVQGRRIRDVQDGELRAGKQELVWDGRNNEGETVPAGVYFYRLSTRGLVESRKIILRR
jgi:hypothetical protein